MTKIFTDAENIAWQKSLPGKMTSACLAIRAEGRLLMLKAGYKDHWTFPGGVVDRSESPKAAAIRETFEETGLQIDPANVQLLTVVYTAANKGFDDRFNFAFITDLDHMPTTLAVPNDEIELAEWVVPGQVAELSGSRGSYTNLQRLLLNPDIVEPFVEVFPAA